MPKYVRNALIAFSICTTCAVSTPLAKGAAPDRHGGQAITTMTADADLVTATQFLKALLARDERSLRPYGPGFFENGKLNQTTRGFLYTPDPAHKKHSVNQIAADGDLQIVLLHQKAKIVTVIYVPKKYKPGLKKQSFLEDEWMNKYFVCEFDTTKP
jgi:hypothetical protein